MYHNSSVKQSCLLKKYPLLTKNTFWKGFLCSCQTEAFDGNDAVQMKACELWKVVVQTKLEGIIFWDEINNYEYEIFSYNNIEHVQTGLILEGKTWYHCHFSTRFWKHVVVSKQVKNTVAVLAFFNQQKDSVSSNKNNWATNSGNKE